MVIFLTGSDIGERIPPQIATSWFIQNIISDYILLIFEVRDNFDPHLDEHIEHTIFIFVKILAKADHIEGCVV